MRARIAHVMPWTIIGGAEFGTLRLAKTAQAAGFDNVIAIPPGGSAVAALFADAGFETITFDEVIPSLTKPKHYIPPSIKLARELRRRQVDIVDCADIRAAFYGGLAGWLAGCAVISHVRCEIRDLTWRTKIFLKPVQHYVFVSHHSRNVFNMKLAASQAEVIYDSIAPTADQTFARGDARAHYGIPAEAFTVGMAARVHPGKDLETLIRAAAIAATADPSLFVLVAGDNQRDPGHRAYYDQLQSLLAELSVADRVRFAGFEGQMDRFFAAIDVFTLASHAEGLPLVILEAMAHHHPVVATDVGGISEAVENETTGLLVPPQDPERLAKAWLRLARDRSERERLVHNADDLLAGRFSEAKFREAITNLYERLTPGRALRPGFLSASGSR
jgi:glycosyltransferase involved in cell wall biosynthesis